MDRSILSLILLLIFSMINSKLIPTNDLKLALSEAEPGDIIELKSGIYRDAPYSLKSGSQGKPIIIRSATYADIVFSGNQNSCIFNGEETSYISIEGPMVFKNALCGIEILNGYSINITGIIVTDMKEHGIVISGKNLYIYNNTISSCSLKTKEIPAEQRHGYSGQWKPGIEICERNYYNLNSINITIKDNIIRDSYGEGIRINYCDECVIIKNNITNTLNMSIYI